MDTGVNFYSDLFKPFLPEDSQVNPVCYGAELAWWLAPRGKGLFGRKKAPLQLAERLLVAVGAILRETQGITDIRWHSDFS